MIDWSNRARVLLAVTRLHAALGRSPTYVEMVDATGLSRSVVNKWLHRLRWDGLVEFEPGRRGTLRPRVREVS